jgi:hypothetical protein
MAKRETGRTQLLDVWKRVKIKLGQGSSSPTEIRFSEYAWNKFDPDLAFHVLTSPSPGFFGQKTTLYAALCAWVLAPNDRRFRQSAITVAFASALAEEEERARKIYDDIGQLGDIWVRIAGIGPEFFEQIYYPLGGIRQVLRIRSKSGFRQLVAKKSSRISEVVALVTIYHFHAQRLSSNSFWPASIKKGSTLVSRINGQLGGERSVKYAWKSNSLSCQFLYAASDVVVKPGVSLLDEMLAGSWSFARHRKFLIEWLSKSKYVQCDVLSRVAKSKALACTFIDMADIDTQPFDCAVLSDAIQRDIEATFRKTAAPRLEESKQL